VTRLHIVNWPVAIAGCIICYLISVLTLGRTAAYLGLVSRLPITASLLARDIESDSTLRKIRIAGVGVVSFLMGSYLLYLMIIGR
jgi:hypothetical protein